MNKFIPKYLVQKTNVIMMVLGTALFAEIFINIFQPFGSRDWLPDSDNASGGLLYFALATVVVLIAMGIIAISRTIMYKHGKKHEITYWQYALWIVAEVAAMAMIYTTTVVVIYALYPRIAQSTQSLDFMHILSLSFLYTTFILFIPYSVFILYFSFNDKKNKLQNINNEDTLTDEKSTILNFYDEKGELGISIHPEHLYYITAADNYVDILYKNGGKLKHFLLRQSLKKLEETFSETNLTRCHRSYIVNLAMVKVLRRADDGIYLDFDDEQIEQIPVSKTYRDKVIDIFTKM